MLLTSFIVWFNETYNLSPYAFTFTVFEICIFPSGSKPWFHNAKSCPCPCPTCPFPALLQDASSHWEAQHTVPTDKHDGQTFPWETYHIKHTAASSAKLRTETTQPRWCKHCSLRNRYCKIVSDRLIVLDFMCWLNHTF